MPQQFQHIPFLHVRKPVGGVQLCIFKQFVNQPVKPCQTPLYHFNVFIKALPVFRSRFLQQLHIASDGGKRTAQIMGNIGNQLILTLLLPFFPFLLFPELDGHLIDDGAQLGDFIVTVKFPYMDPISDFMASSHFAESVLTIASS